MADTASSTQNLSLLPWTQDLEDLVPCHTAAKPLVLKMLCI